VISRSDFMEATEESEHYYVNPEKQQNTMIFAPPHNSELVAEVCANLGVSLSRSFCGKFSDGECSIKVQDEVRGADCFLIQMIPRDGGTGSSHKINDSIMEMLLMTAALRRASARSITVVLPYVPYARHMEGIPDGEHLTPMAASDIAQLIESIGADRVICVDVHRGTWEGCFSSTTRVSNIDPQVLAVKYFEQKRLVDPVVVSPDVVASDRAKAFYKRMRMHGFSCQLATMVSDRKYQYQVNRVTGGGGGQVRIMDNGKIILPSGKEISLAALMTREWLVGDVSGRDCIIVDDMIDSGKRLQKTSETLKKCGARRIYFYATHGVISGSNAIKRIDQSPVSEVVITNTLPPIRDIACDKLRILSIAGLLSETIRRIQMGESVSSLYDTRVIDTALEERLNPNDHSSLL
jgi:ribose-phosphate pyrophosphokinase